VIAEAVPPPAVLERMRAPLLAGAERIDPPVLQPLGAYLELLGEGMRGRLFTVDGEGAEDACLRPDLTVAVAREHLARGAATGRYFYEGVAFRAAPAGSSRPQEFLQLGAERLGGRNAERDDAETVAAAFRAAEAGGRTDLLLVMGELSLFDDFCAGLGVGATARTRLKRRLGSAEAFRAELERTPAPSSDGRLSALLGGLPADEATQVLEELWTLAGVTAVGGRSAGEIASRLAERGRAGGVSNAQASLIARWVEIGGEPLAAIAEAMVLARRAGVDLHGRLEGCARRVAALATAGVELGRMRLDFGFGRPFGYYDGFLFEIRSAALPEDAPVAAGGRYDGLLGRLQPGAEAPAVGCMVRPGRAWVGA
jgi:ATP phosphoribosyltransferase regulatory subunit